VYHNDDDDDDGDDEGEVSLEEPGGATKQPLTRWQRPWPRLKGPCHSGCLGVSLEELRQCRPFRWQTEFHNILNTNKKQLQTTMTRNKNDVLLVISVYVLVRRFLFGFCAVFVFGCCVIKWNKNESYFAKTK
jgi:hypothetical protein